MRNNLSYLALSLSFFVAAYSVAFGQSSVVISDFERSAYENVYDLLAGKLSGLRVSGTDGNPNSKQSIMVRGGGSPIRSLSSPLFVVDGVVLDNAVNCSQDAFWQYGESAYTSVLNPLAFLSVYDIDKIEVLKDQSATAMYGSRGAAGVILITTRRGQDKKFHSQWNSDVTIAPGLSHSHSVNVGGSTENLQFSLSGFFRNIDHNVANLGSTYSGGKVSVQSSGNASVNFGANSIYVIGNSSNPIGTAWFGSPSQGYAMRNESAFGTELKGWYNDYDDDNKEIRSLNSIYLDVAIGHYVRWTTKAGIDFRKNSRVIWFGNGTLFGGQNNGAAAQTSSSVFSYNASTAFNYGQYIAKKHLIKATLFADVFSDVNTYNTLNGVNFFTHELRGNGLSLMSCEKKLHSFSTDYFNFGSMLSVGYDYDRILGADGGLRAELTPQYDDNVQLYPFADVYLDVRKALFAESKGVSTLRLSGGYGVSGNQVAMPYELCSSYIAGSLPEVENGAEPYHKGFNRIVSSGWHLSAEAGFIDDRILVSASFYDSTVADTFHIQSFGNKDGVYWKSAPRSILHTFTSSFHKSGVEVDLNASAVKCKNFTWDISTNLSYETNIITEIAQEDQKGSCIGGGVCANMNIIGQPLGTIIGYVQEENGSLKDVNRDTKITQADKIILGNSLPNLYGSLGMTFGFYGISVSMLFRGTIGYDLVNLNAMAEAGTSEVTSAYVEDADWLRLSRLSIGYDIPLTLKWLDSLNVNISATDLFSITPYSGWNPDINSYGYGVMRGGYDYGSLPLAPRVILGVCAKF